MCVFFQFSFGDDHAFILLVMDGPDAYAYTCFPAVQIGLITHELPMESARMHESHLKRIHTVARMRFWYVVVEVVVVDVVVAAAAAVRCFSKAPLDGLFGVW